MNGEEERKDRPYDETLEAARMLEEISESPEKPTAPSDGEMQTSGEGATGDSEAAETPPDSQVVAEADGEERQEDESSIGELFSGLVRKSPPEKIRVEKGSIGALFKKYIEKRP
jgi:hypothetical protein